MTSNVATMGDETQQLLRTVEMFETIIKTQPDDSQSLEILKEAYTKLRRRDESLGISKKLAKVYAGMGQFSRAILEYESILEQSPGDQDAQKALQELEEKNASRHVAVPSGAPSSDDNSKPPPAGVPTRAAPGVALRATTPDGDQLLTEVLIVEKIITEQAVRPLLQKLRAERQVVAAKGQTMTLVQLIVDQQMAKLDDLLSVIVDRSGLPYMPLSSYDADRDIVQLLPRETSFGWGVVPFEIISRSALIAIANPFDMAIREEVQAKLGYNTFWYLSSQAEITQTLRSVYRLDAKGPNTKSL